MTLQSAEDENAHRVLNEIPHKTCIKRSN